VAALVARGIGVTVLTTRWHESWPEVISWCGATVVRMARRPEGFFGKWRMLRDLSQRLRAMGDQVDVVYVCGLRHDAYVAMQSIDRGRTAVVLRDDKSGPEGDCLWQVEVPQGQRIRRKLIGADGFVAASEIARRELVAAGYPRDRIQFAPGGVLPSPRRSGDGKKAARAALESANTLLHCPPGAPVAVYTGRLDRTQNACMAIDAWRRVVARWPGARLWLVGPNANQSELHRRIEAEDLVGRVVPVGSFTDVEELLAAADAVIVPGGEAGAAALVLEAMAAGVPVVAGSDPENGCLIGDDEFGRLVPLDDSRALGRALGDIFAETGRARQAADAAQAKVEQVYGVDQVADLHVELFEQLMQRKRSLSQS